MYNNGVIKQKGVGFMKKFITALLIITMVMCVSVPLMAETENLLENPTFEYGIDNWTKYGAEVEESEESQDGDNCSVLITERTEAHSSIKQDLIKIIKNNGKGKYKITAYAKVKKMGSIKLAPVARVRFSSDSKPAYNVGKRVAVNSNEWTKIELSFNIAGEVSELVQADLYFTQDSSESNYLDYYLDNVSFTKIDAVITPEPTPSVTATPIPVKTDIQRADKLRIGAIRWDAYYKTTGHAGNVSDQVAACLSPSEYHWTAPFFADITAEGNITFPEYTLETFEKECDYAIDAGIDYFAYVWYETFNEMSSARKYHVQSSKHDQIKMCAIIESIKDDKTMKELFSAMKEDYYLKVDGMPIVYVNENKDFNYVVIQKLRSMAADAGVETPLYVVYMKAPTTSQGLELPVLGYDAVTMYCVRPDTKGMSYADLVKAVANINESTARKFRTSNKTYQYIPLIQFGRDTQSRIKTGVSWTGDYGGNFAYSGTAQELAAHTLDVLKWTFNNTDVTEANAVISYAWNEHDEGGWLCPTLKVDANGDLVLDANGNKQANTEYLDSVKTAISQFRDYEANNEASSPTPQVTQTPGQTGGADAYNDDNDAIVLKIAFTGAAVVVAIAVVAVIVVVVMKKKNNKKEQ